MKKIYILQLQNRGIGDVSKMTQEFQSELTSELESRGIFYKIDIEIRNVDVDIDNVFIPPYTRIRDIYGVLKTLKIEPNGYHIIQFIYKPETTSNLAFFAYRAPYFGQMVCEYPFIQGYNMKDAFIHETLHAFHALFKQNGFDMNDDLDNWGGNDKNLDRLCSDKQKFDVVFSIPLYRSILLSLISLLKIYYTRLVEAMQESTNGQKMLEVAKMNLGKSLGNKYIEVGCVDEINAIAEIALGYKLWLSDYTGYVYDNMLADKKRFLEVSREECKPGDLIISPSGLGDKTKVSNGHIGLIGEDDVVYANDSTTGKISNRLTIDYWYTYWGGAGYPIKFFRLIA